ncbi:MAG: hypothetical protein ACKOCR_07700, partial [Burkholderiaceae bacterium]
TFEYVMLDGINDSLDHCRQLVKLIRAEEISCKFNLIPFNPFPSSGYRTSPWPRVRAFADLLTQEGFVTTIRKTRGDDIDAACGQLAGDIQDRTKITLRTKGAAPTLRPLLVLSSAASPLAAARQPAAKRGRWISLGARMWSRWAVMRRWWCSP